MKNLILLTVLSVAASQAAVIGVSGDGVIMTPVAGNTGATANFFNDTGSNVLVRAWDEQQNVTLGQNLLVDIVSPGTYTDSNYVMSSFSILSGTVISSHLLFFDPLNTTRKVARFEFDADILGLILESGNNLASDKLHASDFLGNPLTAYPATRYNVRGIEFGPEVVTLEVGLRFLEVDLSAGNPGDQIRVITAASSEVPEPGSLALIGSALLGLGWWRRRR